MRISRALVIYKKSSYELYARVRKDRGFLKILAKGHIAADRFLSSHHTHQESLRKVKEVLLQRGIQARYAYRAHSFSESGVDLILTVGGDGTFLEASHRVIRTPMLGVNSSPADSVGIFCGIRADQLDSTLALIEKGRLQPIDLTRLSVSVGKTKIPTPVLNDVLVTHSNPAATSRYFLHMRGRREEQKSSGLWISTPAGSTAALGSAGGKYLSIGSRSYQYRVREPYELPENPYHFRIGLLRAGEKLVVFSKMRVGKIYLDGPHLAHRFPIGEKLTVSSNAPRLKVFAFNEKRRRMFQGEKAE